MQYIPVTILRNNTNTYLKVLSMYYVTNKFHNLSPIQVREHRLFTCAKKHTGSNTHEKQGHKICLNIHSPFAKGPFLDRYHQSPDNDCGARKGPILPLHCMKWDPVGLKVNLYHQDKSLHWYKKTNLQSRIPHSPSTTPKQFIGIFTISTWALCRSFFFSELQSLRNWQFSTFVTLKYAAQFPRHCPVLHHVHNDKAYVNWVMWSAHRIHVFQSECKISYWLFFSIKMLDQQKGMAWYSFF